MFHVEHQCVAESQIRGAGAGMTDGAADYAADSRASNGADKRAFFPRGQRLAAAH